MKQKGFTLVETLIAILILTVSVGALLSLTTSGFYSIRYSKNQIVANFLMQESLEYIRNTRDTASQQGKSWDEWRNLFYVDSDGKKTGSPSDGCFSENTCYIDTISNDKNIRMCEGSIDNCQKLSYYPEHYIYAYSNVDHLLPLSEFYDTNFTRSIKMKNGEIGEDHVIVNVTISWMNGTNYRSISQSMLLTRWNQK